MSTTVSPLRQRMMDDMNARKLGAHSQRSHISSCKRFAAFLKRSPDTATPDDVRRFQLHLAETDMSICNRNRIMTGVKFLFRITLRRPDLAAEIYHLREPQKIPQVMSQDEARRLLAVASRLKVRVLLSLAYGCGLRAGESVRLKVKHIDRAQNIIRIEQSKGRKDRNVMLSAEALDLLRQWWKARPPGYDATTPVQERWLFPGRRPGKPMTTRQLSRLFHEAANDVGIKKSVASSDRSAFQSGRAEISERTGRERRARKLKWTKGGKMTEIFPSTRELQDVRGVSAVPPRGPLARRKHRRVKGTRGEGTETTPGVH